MKRGMIAVLLVACLCMPMQGLAAEAAFAPFVAYLQEASVPVDALAVEGEDYGFGAYDVLLMGEGHGTQKTYIAEKNLVEYLVREQGIRHLAMEIGVCDAQLVGRYLQTGDEAYIRMILGELKGTAAYTMETFAFYKWLGELNGTLADGDKLDVYGMDVQHQMFTGLAALSLLLPEEEAPEEIAQVAEVILRGRTFAPMSGDTMLESLDANRDVYEAYLGENFAAFVQGAESIRQGIEFYKKHDSAYREACLKENFAAALEANGDARWAGIFGQSHTALSAGDANMGGYLVHSYAATKDKVGSISFLYTNSKAMNPDGGEAIVLDEMPLAKMVAGTMPSDVSFCRLDTPQSPFGKDGEESLKSQQYIVIIEDSPAAEPYQE